MTIRTNQLPATGETLVDLNAETLVTYVGPHIGEPVGGEYSRVITAAGRVKPRANRTLIALREFNRKASDGKFGKGVADYAHVGEGLVWDEALGEPNALLWARYIVDSVAIDVDESFEYRENES
jgi:hypothetical protein